MDCNGQPQTIAAVTSGVFTLYWTLLSLVLFLRYSSIGHRLIPLIDKTYCISAFHVCVYLWGVLAGNFYFFSLLFNVIGGEALRVLNWLAFSAYVGWIYFVGLGISCGYTWHKSLKKRTSAYLVGTGLARFTVSLLAFTENKHLLYFISAFSLALFAFQLLCVYRTTRAVERKSKETNPQDSVEIYSQFHILFMILITLSLLFGIECVGTYMVYGDGMKPDNPVYFLCFAVTNTCVQSLLMRVARPKAVPVYSELNDV